MVAPALPHLWQPPHLDIGSRAGSRWELLWLWCCWSDTYMLIKLRSQHCPVVCMVCQVPPGDPWQPPTYYTWLPWGQIWLWLCEFGCL